MRHHLSLPAAALGLAALLLLPAGFPGAVAENDEITIEVDDELEDFIREHLATSPVGHRIVLHLGDASHILPTLGADFDLVLIDANKRDYCTYYELVLPLVKPGGFILADNTLWGGKVADPDAHHDAQTSGIIAFNQLVAQDPRVEKVILPLRDGLTIIRKIPTDQ